MMQSWEKIHPAAKVGGIVGVLAILLLIFRPGLDVPDQATGVEPQPAPEMVSPVPVETAEPDEQLAEPTPAPETAEVTPEPQEPPIAEEAPAPISPSFDVVRIAPDGNALIAGVAEPGSEVVVQISGAEAARVRADRQGKFVAMFDLPPSEISRALTLRATGPDGAEISSTDTLFVQPQQVVAPKPAQVETATADPKPQAEPATAPEPDAEPTPKPDRAAEEAPQSPTVVVANQDGVRVLQSAVDQDPALQSAVVIEVISYTDNGDVTFAGRAANGQFVRLYLNNGPIGGIRVDQTGHWSGVFSDIAPGIYTLRADQVDGGGKVTSRFETPFQRVEREVVMAHLTDQNPEPDPASPQSETPTTQAPDVAPEPVVEAPAQTAATTAPKPTAEPAPPVAANPSEPTDGQGATDIAAEREPTLNLTARGPVSITVQPGNTLWAIAEANYGDGLKYVEVFQANRDKIRNPDLIYPGQIFAVPPQE